MIGNYQLLKVIPFEYMLCIRTIRSCQSHLFPLRIISNGIHMKKKEFGRMSIMIDNYKVRKGA